MPTVKEIAEYFEELAPSQLKSEFDNVGLLVGCPDDTVTRVLVALDITEEVIAEAASLKAELIVSHHPVFFELKRVSKDEPTGARIIKLIQNGVSALCLHTNLDRVKGGVNDALCRALGLEALESLDTEKTAPNGAAGGMGRIGALAEPAAMSGFLSEVKKALKADGLRFYDSGSLVSRVAVCGGTGGGYVETAHSKGCDTLVTADVKHHEFLTAKALGLNVIDAGHYRTENVVVPVIASMLKSGFPALEVTVSEDADAPMSFYT
jgi:dinuclear metal center YbgI/SA1388 family protein